MTITENYSNTQSSRSNITYLVDTHCHLQDERLAERLETVIEHAKAIGIRFFVCCGSSPGDWQQVEQLAQKYGNCIIPSFGIHPWYLEQASADWLELLQKYLEAIPSAAVGEIGLDHAIAFYDERKQREIFVAQLRLARSLARPVTIHCRRAFGALLDILNGEGASFNGLIHSYSGSADMVPLFSEYGLYFSFSCSLTYSGNKRAHKAAAVVSVERLLVETDSPDIPPLAIRDKPNEPANIIYVINKLAELRNETAVKTGQICGENAMRLFGKSGDGKF